MIDPFSDAKIVDSWMKNVGPWTDAIRDDQIESRRLVTNAAIMEAVLSQRPASVLDVGCGEGWLVRALAKQGVQAIGVDAVPGLIEEARRIGGGEYRVASYEEIAAGALDLLVDVVVANFSLIGKESVENLVVAAGRLLNPGGSLVIQTLHPRTANEDTTHPYMDGWRTGSWAGFSSAFTDPAPWYFRTLGSWIRLLVESKWRLHELREPLHPATGQPASVIFIAHSAG